MAKEKKERFIKLNDVIYTETDVNNMSMDEITELLSKLAQEVSSLSIVKKQLMVKGFDNMTRQEIKAVTSVCYKQSKFISAQNWVSVIRKNISRKMYMEKQFNKEFVKVAESELKKSMFQKIADKAMNFVRDL